MKIRKAVILAAGLGTRFFPVTKAVPKELLPVVDKPVLHYLVEEAVHAGLKEIIFVISPEKRAVKDYFARSPKIEFFLKERKKLKILQELKKISRLAHFSYFEQKKPLGQGDAILRAQSIIKDEPFALFFGDDLINSPVPCLKQMLTVYQKYKTNLLAVARVPRKEISHYGVVKIRKIASRLYQVLDLVEKPSLRQAPSNLAIVGRYILFPEILKIFAKMKPKKGGEVYLADALKILLTKQPLLAYEYQGEWLSCGHKIGWLLANLKIGLEHPETKEELRKFLTEKNYLIK